MYNDATMGTNVAERKSLNRKDKLEISKALECLEKEILHARVSYANGEISQGTGNPRKRKRWFRLGGGKVNLEREKDNAMEDLQSGVFKFSAKHLCGRGSDLRFGNNTFFNRQAVGGRFWRERKMYERLSNAIATQEWPVNVYVGHG